MPSAKFNLDASILGAGSAASIEISGQSSSDVLQAVLNNSPFPDRRIDLASVAFEAEAGRDIRFHAGRGAVAFRASGGAHARLAVVDKAEEVLGALALADAPRLGFTLGDQDGVRYLLFLAGYEAEGQFDGSHPIGMLGSVSFGVEAKHGRLFAVIHRFPRDRGAAEATQSAVAAFRLPRHVNSAGDLPPGTALVAEAEGSVAWNLAAQLGYDFSFVREASALGLTGDIGLKVDAGLKATLGLEAAGRFLVTLDRESLDPGSALARLRLFKLSKKGWNFGLNLSSSVQGEADILPHSADELVKAVFGVHGQQVMKDLLLVEKWTSPTSDLSDTVAGLIKDTGLDLLRRTTGIDPEQSFDRARAVLLEALRQWDSLPDRAAGVLWRLLESGSLTGDARQKFESALALLAGTEEDRRKELLRLLETAGVESTPLGGILSAVAHRGLLSLLDRLEDVRSVAAVIRQILNGGVIEKLQTFLAEKLNLDPLLKAATETDFATMEGWLVNRLSTFLDRKLRFEDLEEIKNAIHAVISRRQEIYEKARNALARQYDFSLAYAWQKTTERTALIDATFDLGEPDALALMKEVIGHRRLDNLLVRPVRGVTLHQGVLTHELNRRSSVEVNLPYYNSRSDRINRSLASVRAVEDGGRVLFYELDSRDETALRNRMKSQLSLAAAVPLSGGAVRVHSAGSASWTYQYRMARENMRRVELERLIAPFIERYLPGHFAGGGQSSLSTWLSDLDRRIEEEIGRPTDDFGDVLLSMEVTLPAAAVRSWVAARTEEDLRAAAMNVSRRLQAGLKELIPFYYFQDLGRLRRNLPAAALLVYESIPPSTNIRVQGGTALLNADFTDKKEKRVHWDWRDPDKRRRMVMHPQTLANLAVRIAAARQRLLDAGLAAQAGFLDPGDLGAFLVESRWQQPDGHLGGLLRLEDAVVTGAAEALRQNQGFHKDARTMPSKAITALAEFGAEVTRTFNERLASLYGTDALRPLGSMLFLEGSRVLDPAIGATPPQALLSLTVLREERAFDLPGFLQGEAPKREEIAVAQRLVSGEA